MISKKGTQVTVQICCSFSCKAFANDVVREEEVQAHGCLGLAAIRESFKALNEIKDIIPDEFSQGTGKALKTKLLFISASYFLT